MRKAWILLLIPILLSCHKAPRISNPVAVVLDTAHQMKGVSYRYGGRNPNGFDCSGLVWYCYDRAGIVVPIDTDHLRKAGSKVTGRWNIGKLKRGDLMFFRVDRMFGRPNHVGIYVGNNRMIHASTSRGVVLDSLDNEYWKAHFTYARRIIK